jgi:hypothetical protein
VRRRPGRGASAGRAGAAIFQGLALSLMAGEVAATLLSRLAVPVVYYLIARRGRAAALALAREETVAAAA